MIFTIALFLYLHNGISYTDKIIYLYWISPQGMINRLRASFYRGNINMLLHFMSFLHNDMP